MKKYFMSLILAVICCMTAFAGDEISLTSGSIASLKNGGTGYVVLDMTDTQFDNKMPLRQDGRFMDVDAQLPECTKEFVREFNDNTKKFTLTENADEAQYEFLVKITNLDVFIHVMSFKGGIGIKLWGSVTITNKADGSEVAVFTIDDEGNSGFNYQIALEEGFEGIAKYLAKRIKKGK